MGVKNYTCYVTDGHIDYESVNAESIQATAKYPALTIAQQTNADQFIQRLKLHQQGGTDYLTFCKDCADTGIEKWAVDLTAMTCTYYDTAGNNILVENTRKYKNTVSKLLLKHVNSAIIWTLLYA